MISLKFHFKCALFENNEHSKRKVFVIVRSEKSQRIKRCTRDEASEQLTNDNEQFCGNLTVIQNVFLRLC